MQLPITIAANLICKPNLHLNAFLVYDHPKPGPGRLWHADPHPAATARPPSRCRRRGCTNGSKNCVRFFCIRMIRLFAPNAAMNAIDRTGHLSEGLGFAIKGAEVLGIARAFVARCCRASQRRPIATG